MSQSFATGSQRHHNPNLASPQSHEFAALFLHSLTIPRWQCLSERGERSSCRVTPSNGCTLPTVLQFGGKRRLSNRTRIQLSQLGLNRQILKLCTDDAPSLCLGQLVASYPTQHTGSHVWGKVSCNSNKPRIIQHKTNISRLIIERQQSWRGKPRKVLFVG
jgi:hypothetical protein